MQHDPNDTISLLSHTPAALDSLLRGLPATWISRNEGENTWNVVGVIGHLIHTEQNNWIPRIKMVLEAGESQTFAPLNREGHARDIEGKSIAQLLDTFARLRSENMQALRALNIGADDLQRRGRHPALGTVTLSELLATWATHDLTHLHQITRILAYQYRETVGPFRRFLGVLQCEGHSSAA